MDLPVLAYHEQRPLQLRCGNAEAEVSLQIELTGVSLPRAVYAVR